MFWDPKPVLRGGLDIRQISCLQWMKQGSYKKGELVLVADEALKNQVGKKGSLRWFGPYAMVLQRVSGVFILQELDGTVLRQPVA